ncbi:hypothetical protein ACS0TY_002981 [Phlomoides rotata]
MEDQGALHYQRDQLQGMNSMITKSASPKVIIFHQPPRPSQPFATLQDQFQAVKKLLQKLPQEEASMHQLIHIGLREP